MPFKAVSGLDEALEKKRMEMGVIEKRELFEDEISTVDSAMRSLKEEDFADISYFSEGKYCAIKGIISEINEPREFP